MRRLFRGLRFCLYFFVVICISLTLKGCVKKPYLISNAFESIGINLESENYCVAVLIKTKVDYFLCEPKTKSYRIKIIPSENDRAILLIIPEQNFSDDSFESVIQKDIKQVSIGVTYSLEESNRIKDLYDGKGVALAIKSFPDERYYFEALFLVERYLSSEESRSVKLK